MEIVYTGWLEKSPGHKHKTVLRKGRWSFRLPVLKAKWRRRFFVLKRAQEGLPHRCTLEYFKDMSCRSKLGSINMASCSQILHNLDSCHYRFLFSLLTHSHKHKNQRMYYLAADTEQEMHDWVKWLCGLCGLIKEDENAGMDTAGASARSPAAGASAQSPAGEEEQPQPIGLSTPFSVGPPIDSSTSDKRASQSLNPSQARVRRPSYDQVEEDYINIVAPATPNVIAVANSVRNHTVPAVSECRVLQHMNVNPPVSTAPSKTHSHCYDDDYAVPPFRNDDCYCVPLRGNSHCYDDDYAVPPTRNENCCGKSPLRGDSHCDDDDYDVPPSRSEIDSQVLMPQTPREMRSESGHSIEDEDVYMNHAAVEHYDALRESHESDDYVTDFTSPAPTRPPKLSLAGTVPNCTVVGSQTNKAEDIYNIPKSMTLASPLPCSGGQNIHSYLNASTKICSDSCGSGQGSHPARFVPLSEDLLSRPIPIAHGVDAPPRYIPMDGSGTLPPASDHTSGPVYDSAVYDNRVIITTQQRKDSSDSSSSESKLDLRITEKTTRYSKDSGCGDIEVELAQVIIEKSIILPTRSRSTSSKIVSSSDDTDSADEDDDDDDDNDDDDDDEVIYDIPPARACVTIEASRDLPPSVSRQCKPMRGNMQDRCEENSSRL